MFTLKYLYAPNTFRGGEEVVIFGAGRGGRAALEYLQGIQVSVICFIDNLPEKAHTTFEGVPVINASEMTARVNSSSPVVISGLSEKVTKEILEQLITLGFHNLIYISCPKQGLELEHHYRFQWHLDYLEAQITFFAAQQKVLRTQWEDLAMFSHQQSLKHAALQELHWGVKRPNEPFFPMKPLDEDLLRRFSMNGQIPVSLQKVRDTEHVFRDACPKIYDDWMIDAFTELIRTGKPGPMYGELWLWFYKAMERFPIKGKEGLILGSITPYQESLCLYYGASPTTVDYNEIIALSKRIAIMSLDLFLKAERTFDFGISISSVEHSGLGIYGEPYDPDGDLEAMRNIWETLKPDGILYFSVPIGKDAVHWAHRSYGHMRLPLLLEGWEILETITPLEHLLDLETPHEPLLILKKGKKGSIPSLTDSPY